MDLFGNFNFVCVKDELYQGFTLIQYPNLYWTILHEQYQNYTNSQALKLYFSSPVYHTENADTSIFSMTEKSRVKKTENRKHRKYIAIPTLGYFNIGQAFCWLTLLAKFVTVFWLKNTHTNYSFNAK